MSQNSFDPILRKAVEYLLESVGKTVLVTDLVVIEVDWGGNTPAAGADSVEITFQGRKWPLVYTNSELVFRRAICGAAENRAIIAVPIAFQIASLRDVMARAHGGAIQRLGLRHRLFALTDQIWPSEVDHTGWSESVQRHLDALISNIGGHSITNQMVARDQLEQSLVKAAFGLEVANRNTPQLLADLVMFQLKNSVSADRLERSLLRGQLSQHNVQYAPVVMWAAEEQGRAEILVRTGIMMAAEQMARRMPNWGLLNRLRALLVSENQLAERDAVELVIDLASQSLTHLHSSTKGRIAREAQGELRGVLPDDAYNPWFPDLLDRSCQRLADRLAQRNAVDINEVSSLSEHMHAPAKQRELAALADMAVLVQHWTHDEEIVNTFVHTSEWAKWYAHRGAIMDWTGRRLQQGVERGVQVRDAATNLLNSYWQWRDRLNYAFAQAFLNEYEDALHQRDQQVFGTHRILPWVVDPLCRQGKRVLLLIIDGMNYVDFHCILANWESQNVPVYAHQDHLALSLLPSVTSVSRKGLFLGQLPTDRLDDEETYRDKAKTSEASALRKALPQTANVHVYHKGTIDQLAANFAFQDAHVVAAIFNHIDDDLRSTNFTVNLPKPEDLGTLITVVEDALRNDWQVIITADHGHTWFRDRQFRRGRTAEDGRERYAPLASLDSLPDDAITTMDPHIVATHDKNQLALLTAVGSYFGSPRRGYHGGASLEEVVVPCAFLRFQPPAVSGHWTQESAHIHEVSIPSSAPDQVEGIILQLSDGRRFDLQLPFAVSTKESRLLQTLAQMEEASEDDLRKALNTRRVSGIVAGLIERLAKAGPSYDLIEAKGAGSGGANYRFRREILS